MDVPVLNQIINFLEHEEGINDNFEQVLLLSKYFDIK